MLGLLDDLTSGDDVRAEQCISGLAQLGEAVLPALLELTGASNTDVRWWATRALAALPTVRGEIFIPLMHDPAPDVRAAAILALCARPTPDAIPTLLERLHDEDSLTAGLASTALAKTGGDAVLPLIAAASPGGKMSVRIAALRALSEMRDHRAIPLLMKSMSEESAVLQYWAQTGLERLGLDMVYIKP